jgi:hypothetical protein
MGNKFRIAVCFSTELTNTHHPLLGDNAGAGVQCTVHFDRRVVDVVDSLQRCLQSCHIKTILYLQVVFLNTFK